MSSSRSRTLVVLLLLLLSPLVGVRPAHAQDPSYADYDPQNWFKPACPRCGIESWIDIAKITTGGLLIAGWGVECESGRAIDRVDTFYEGDDGFFHAFHADYQWLGAVPRPDVVAYLQPTKCPTVVLSSGFHVYSEEHIPPGQRRIIINVRRGPYYQQHVRTVTFE